MRWDFRSGQQPFPIVVPESAPEGNRAVMEHKRVPPKYFRDEEKQPTTPLGPLQIIDEPTDPRCGFHPSQEIDDLIILQMMCHQRTQDDIRRSVGPIHQSVAGHPLYS